MAAAAATKLVLLSPRPPLPAPSPFLLSCTPFFYIRNPRFHHNHNHNHPNSIPKTPFSSLSSRNGGGIQPPETGCPVPLDQQPVNEYQNISTSFPFSWASSEDFVHYSSRLFLTGVSFTLFVGLPVAWFGSVGPDSNPLKQVFGALSSGIFVVTLLVLRMYLGWAYVGNRLLSATVECNPSNPFLIWSLCSLNLFSYVFLFLFNFLYR